MPLVFDNLPFYASKFLTHRMAVIVLLLHVLTPAHGARPPEIVMDIRSCLLPSTLLRAP
jgi:hypothetical protein